MTLLSANMDTELVQDQLDIDFRQEHPFLDILMQSPNSQQWLRDSLRPNGFAQEVKKARINTLSALSPTDGYTTASYPGAEDLDTSTAFDNIVDDQAVLYNNRLYVHCFKLSDIQRQVHIAGELLESAVFQSASQKMMADVEQSVIAQLISQGRPKSVSGSTATDFALRTDSQANFLSDVSALAGDLAAQNVPAGEEKYIVINPAKGYKLLQYTGLLTSLMQSPSNARFDTGVFKMAMGINIVMTNAVSSDSGLVVVPSRVAVVQPVPFKVEVLRSTLSISDYCRIHTLFGWNATGKIVKAADGNAWSIAHEGVVGLSVA